MINGSTDIEKGVWYNMLDNISLYTEKMGKENAISSVNVRVDSTLFSMFDFETISGDISKIDHLQNIVISEKTALKYFNTVDAVGKLLYTPDEVPCTIVGVFKNFPKNTFLNKVEIFRLNQPDSPALNDYANWNYPFFVMLRAGADPQKVTADIVKEFRDKKMIGDSEIKDDVMRLTLIDDIHFDNDIQYDSFEKANYITTITLLSMALIILIIAAINFVNFATSLVPQRIRSINTQKVLGATNEILRTSLVIEALVVAIISFGVSLMLVHFIGTTSFSSLISASINIADNVQLITILGCLALITGLIAGVYPAYYSTSFAPALILKGSFGLSPQGRKLRTSLIGFQFIISFILVATAIFIHVQNNFMKEHDMGFNRENIFNVYVPNDIAKNPSAFRDKIMQNPNIKGLTFGSGALVSNGKMRWGRKYKDDNIQFDCFTVSTEFVDVMKMNIVDGRSFIETDSMRTDGVFIFNETAEKRFGIKVGDKLKGHNDQAEAEVVGIVKDFNYMPMQYAIQPVCLYIMGREPWHYPSTVYIRANGDLAPIKTHIENSLRAVAPNIKTVNVYMMDDNMEYLYKKEDNLAKLVTIFSIVAIMISIIGVFGIVMFDSRYRRKEIAIRKVHGSSITQILMMFTKYYVSMVLICFVISVPIIYYLITRWVENFAYRSEIHWWIFVVSLILIAVITIVTVIVESLRAATENPITSIKSE